jgi:hypothetical protein
MKQAAVLGFPNQGNSNSMLALEKSDHDMKWTLHERYVHPGACGCGGDRSP